MFEAHSRNRRRVALKTLLGSLPLLLLVGFQLLAFADVVLGRQPGFIQDARVGLSKRVVAETAQQEPTQSEPEATPPSEQASGEEKGDNDKESAKEEPKQESTDGPIKRSAKPPKEPDPRELQAAPDPKTGRVRFSFNGQPWPDVLQWLANVTQSSLDWQELPEGYLNLTTQRSYSLDEARNLINRHLQARGYALLRVGEVLSVVKVDAVDPSMLPRVSEEQLYDLQPHDIVKVTYQLPTEMDPKSAVEDVKQALSKHAKVLPLVSTGRLLVIDTVANLRLVSAILNEERIELQGQEIPRRFPLQYARAEKVINTLYVVLGLDPASQPSQMELQVQQQKMQLLMQMQGAGKDVSRMLNADGPRVFLAFNRHENSILANAPERELKIIERAIKFLDIPARGAGQKAAADARRYPHTYELENLNPQNLVSTLEEIGDLDPLTELRADSQAKILFARATAQDHDKIGSLVEQLDDSGQRFEVFWLRRGVPADAVAGTVMALLGEEEEEDDDNDRYWGWGYSRNQDKDKEDPPMRVDADIESNRLLVRGAEEQIEQVRLLLTKMDALSGARSTENPVVLTDPLQPVERAKLLEKLRELWPSVSGGVELTIEGAGRSPRDSQPSADDAVDGAASPPADRTSPPDRTTAKPRPFRLLSSQTAPESTDQASPTKASITITPEGRLLLGSSDPHTLARLERLVNSLTPQPDLFKEFSVEHASAFYIHWKLEDYFEEEIKGDDGEEVLDWYGRWRNSPAKDKGVRLSKRRPLRLIYNKQTNSIVASHATPQQLETIGKLIKTWDKPPRTDLVAARRTGMVKIRYSRANTIAKALKDVYRDLLSSRDKEFDTEDEKGSGFTLERATEIEFSGVDPANGVTKTKPIDVGFDGVLSIGVDEIANVLMISAEKELYASVEAMALTLDEEARPRTTVQVVRTGVPANRVRRALSRALGTPWAGGRPEQQAQQQQPGQAEQEQQQQQQRGRRRR